VNILVALPLFAAAQGALVFATAYISLRIFRARHPAWKFVAMPLSWATWLLAMLAAYAASGGSLSLLQGLVPALILSAISTISSIVCLIAWTLWPVRARPVSGN